MSAALRVGKWACVIGALCTSAALAADAVKPLTFADMPGIKERKVALLDWSRD